MSRFRHHLFVCTNSRPDGGKGSCAAGGQAVRVALERGRIENSRGNPEVTRPLFEGAFRRAREAGR